MTSSTSTAKAAPPRDAASIVVRPLHTGRLVGNLAFLRGEGMGSLRRRRVPFEFPAFAWVVEHPEGVILVDTGADARVRTPRPMRRMVPVPAVEPADEIGSRLSEAGLDPASVRRVVLTHLDWDHAGGAGRFPHAEILVHRPELEATRTLAGRLRYQTKLWPGGFAPRAVDLDDGPYGPFERSRVLTSDGRVRLVPLPGHSAGQVGVVVERPGAALLLCADHVLRQDWFAEDLAAGRLVCLGPFDRRAAVDTSRRLAAFVRERPTVLLPSHDADAPARLREGAVMVA